MITQRRYFPDFDYDDWRPVISLMDRNPGARGSAAFGQRSTRRTVGGQRTT